MKRIYLLIPVIAIALVACGGYENVARAASQSEDAIPQSGNLCGSTNGNGQLISVGSNEFTIKRNGDGRMQVVHVTDQVAIKTSAGPVSLSDLKIGDRVTLVGGPNSDGSFSADTVVLCSGIQGSETNQTQHPATVRNENADAYEKVSGMLNIATILLVGLVWFGSVVFLLLKKRKNLVHVLFFTVFYIYLYKVLDYTLLQFQSLILLQHFVPNLMLNGQTAGESVNLVPLLTLTLLDVKTSLLNILLMTPFGFGLPFITNHRMKRVVIVGALFSVGIELLQLITGFMGKITFRVADINDVIFNTIGVAVGYTLFVVFVRVYRRAFPNWKTWRNPILRYIAERPQISR